MTARRLVLIRHAHAESGGPDEQRVLSSRGQAEAAAIGRWLAEHDVLPDAVVMSPVTRTRQTWAVAADELGRAVPSSTDRRLYANTVEDVLAVVAEQLDEAGTVAIVGHYPSLPATVAHLIGGSDQLRDFPTATIAVLGISGSWSALAAVTLESIETCQS